jgi:hypothetical protein
MRITRNTFERLRNTDLDHSKIQPNQYVEAHNVEASGTGSYFALRNIRGTQEVQTIISSAASGTEVLGAFRVKFTIGGSQKSSIAIITLVSTTLKIWAYDCEGDALYELYEQTVGVDYAANDRVIDAVNFPENGTDIIYFTDNYHEIRQIKCEIPSPYSANFLTSYDLSLTKGGANGTISLTSVGTGGSLFSGTYQFAYRGVDPTSKRFTKWSTLTSPVHVYSDDNGFTTVHSGIGLPTDRKITLSIAPAFDELTHFDYVQLAVVENIFPTAPITASLLEITEISGSTLSFDYKANTRIGTTPLTDITIDLSQIQHVKTLNIKDNRLFAGNVQYTELDFDNGDPEITSGSITSQSSSDSGDSFSDDEFASRYVGHFRDEVYRFGIVYSDEKGNKSPVKPLDLSGVTGNAISSGLTDMKFPARSSSNSYTIFSSLGRTKSLGLQLNGLVNHPSWARSFEIVRVKRKKNILFQTPVIPMSSVYGLGALYNYPTEYTPVRQGEITVADAQPQTSGRVLVPKNLFWPEQRSVVKSPISGFVNSIYYNQGECYLAPSGNTEGYQFSMIFPSDTMYSENAYSFTGAEKLDVVDYALLRVNVINKNQSGKSPAVSTGDDINTSVSGNFYALEDGQYYFNSNFVAKSIDSDYRNIPIVDSETFDNFGESAAVGGNSVMDYDSLQTQSVDWGFKPTIQKCAVVKLGNFVADICNQAMAFANGGFNAYSAGAEIVTGGGLTYESVLTNRYVNEYSGYNANKYVNAIAIANVTLGLGDDRYGDINAYHEYISTGAKYTFSELEVEALESGDSVSVNITVFGGDCFVGPQLFKITDSSYSVVSQSGLAASSPNIDTQISKWGKVFIGNLGGTDSYVLRQPVAVESAAQFVQVVVESEYNAEVREADVAYGINSTASGIPIYNVDTKEAMRTPLTYRYNKNLNQQNDQKVFVPKPQFSFEQNYFGARIAYSDVKIYNTDTVGFDTFRVGNIYDLEEKNYNITKLALSGDDLIAVQERGILYLPIGSQLLEQSDAGTIAVRTGDVVGSPIVLDSERGSQHLRSVVETGGVIYLVDNLNKSVYAISGKQVQPISDLDNDSAFREMLNSRIAEKNLFGIYDPIKKEYWLVDNASHKCHIFSEKYQGWVGEYDFTADSKLFAGVATNQKLYLIGKNENLVVAEMYAGTVNQLFGEEVVPSVTVVCNPDEPVAKTFDNVLISATERLDTMDITVQREVEKGHQTVSGMDIDVPSVEGSYRIKTLRDADGARLRGLRALITIKFKAVQSAIREIATKYRLSSRVPF